MCVPIVIVLLGRSTPLGYLVGYGRHISLSDTGEEERTGHTEVARSKKGTSFLFLQNTVTL